jgi:hypothetical protein
LAPQIPEFEPLVIVAGDYVQWTKSFGDFPVSEGWTLKYRLRSVSGTALGITKTATTSGDTYLITLAKADTSGVTTAQSVRLFGWVEKESTGERYVVYDAWLKVEPNIETAEAADLKTHAVTMLEAINAALEGRLAADIESYGVAGRSVQKIPMSELPRLKGIYEGRVWREQNPHQSHPTHAVQFR